MTLSEFRSSLQEDEAPAGISSALRALWQDARGNWDGAHELAQGIDGAVGAWVHAYLHRKEGDNPNAAYWYRRAGQPIASDSLDEEWDRIAVALLTE